MQRDLLARGRSVSRAPAVVWTCVWALVAAVTFPASLHAAGQNVVSVAAMLEGACRQQCNQPGICSHVDPGNCGQCLKACSIQETKTVVYPKYSILSLVYAPPGCSNVTVGTTTLKCSASSKVDYQYASAMGTKTTIANSFKQGTDTSSGIGLSTSGVKFDFGAQDDITTTYEDSVSETISKASGYGWSVSGDEDGINHDEDQFLILLNPTIAVWKLTNSYGEKTVWDIGVKGASAELYQVYVSELKDPTKTPQVTDFLRGRGLDNGDFQTILAQDPFASAAPDTNSDPFVQRYWPTGISFGYRKPLQESACNNDICTCLQWSDNLKNDVQHEHTSTTKTEYTVGYSFGVSTGGNGGGGGGSGNDSGSSSSAGSDGAVSANVTFNFKSDTKLTWGNSVSTSNSTSSSNSASASIVCPSVGYSGKQLMAVYWDALYGSFLFVPHD